MLLALTSTLNLRSEFHGTHDHILLSEAPQPSDSRPDGPRYITLAWTAYGTLHPPLLHQYLFPQKRVYGVDAQQWLHLFTPLSWLLAIMSQHIKN
jgi:hypothetical protein